MRNPEKNVESPDVVVAAIDHLLALELKSVPVLQLLRWRILKVLNDDVGKSRKSRKKKWDNNNYLREKREYLVLLEKDEEMLRRREEFCLKLQVGQYEGRVLFAYPKTVFLGIIEKVMADVFNLLASDCEFVIDDYQDLLEDYWEIEKVLKRSSDDGCGDIANQAMRDHNNGFGKELGFDAIVGRAGGFHQGENWRPMKDSYVPEFDHNEPFKGDAWKPQGYGDEEEDDGLVGGGC